MNKKNLSVVMAGAMLATSVAPVLAEVTKTEVSADNLGLLIEDLRTKLNSKKFSVDSKRNTTRSGKSVYFITKNGKNLGLEADSSQEDFQTKIGELKDGDVLEVWSYGYVEEQEGDTTKIYRTKEVVPEYTTYSELTALRSALVNQNVTSTTGKFKNVIDVAGTTLNPETQSLTISFTDATKHDPIYIELGSKKIDTTKYVNNNGDTVAVPAGASATISASAFKDLATVDPELVTINENSKVEEITITPGGYSLNVSDLYDGLMLTTEGHDFFTKIKEAQAAGRTVTIKGTNGSTTIGKTTTITQLKSAIYENNKGVSKFSITFGALSDKKVPSETYNISGTDEENAERLASWMIEPLARVDILAGDNRYETAVKIAKENALVSKLNPSYGTSAKEGHIVLVNGDALVDGLAAAPLASTLSAKNGTDAPILLTKSDALPKETKAYLKELIEEYKIKDIDKVTVDLVGGETVLSKDLERELRSLGFTVERFGGDNREETSLEVKEAIEENGGKSDHTFVVGGEGEADAMSIAAVAAEIQAPIVVAKKGGISEDATYELKNDYVTIVGGESVVSNSDKELIKSEAKAVDRVSGSNRQATNAAVISRYYKGTFNGNTATGSDLVVGNAKNVIIAKDGANGRNSELIDALAAANLATQKDAPIVLATNKLSDAQRNALQLNAKGADALYQVGIGVERNVVKYVAELLGLTNRF